MSLENIPISYDVKKCSYNAPGEGTKPTPAAMKVVPFKNWNNGDEQTF